MNFYDAIDPYRGIQPTDRENNKPTTKNLPEGNYTFKITSITTKMAGKSDNIKPLLVLNLTTRGQDYEHQYWLTTETAVGHCYADLVALGLPQGPDFKTQLQKYLPTLVGKSFTGQRKDTLSDSGTVYNNLYIKSVIGGQSLPQPGSRQQPQQQYSYQEVSDTGSSDEIPF